MSSSGRLSFWVVTPPPTIDRRLPGSAFVHAARNGHPSGAKVESRPFAGKGALPLAMPARTLPRLSRPVTSFGPAARRPGRPDKTARSRAGRCRSRRPNGRDAGAAPAAFSVIIDFLDHDGAPPGRSGNGPSKGSMLNRDHRRINANSHSGKPAETPGVSERNTNLGGSTARSAFVHSPSSVARFCSCGGRGGGSGRL